MLYNLLVTPSEWEVLLHKRDFENTLDADLGIGLKFNNPTCSFGWTPASSFSAAVCI